MLKTAFLYHPLFLKHNTGWAHPEKRQRLTAILSHLQTTGIWDRLLHIRPLPSPIEAITAIHTHAYVEQIRSGSATGAMFKPDEVTIGSPGTYEAASMAAGAVLSAIDTVMQHKARNAFCAIRPPGHHALADRAMGFCFFNNIAIGAKYLQRRYNLRNIAIIDWDIHHGNGTQAAFYSDPSIFYFSFHQSPLYPNSGHTTETGDGLGKGFTFNHPLPSNISELDFVQTFKRELIPAMNRFRPDFILISAGFDGHYSDPLASARLTEQGYGELTRIVMHVAQRHCKERLVSALEGGYDLSGLSASVAAHIQALMEPHYEL